MMVYNVMDAWQGGGLEVRGSRVVNCEEQQSQVCVAFAAVIGCGEKGERGINLKQNNT
jgi:hypothetical protein